MKIKMFTKTVCPTCKVAKQQLSFLPVPVEIEEINIETDEPFYDFEGNRIELKVEYLQEKLDSMSTPTFLFEDGDVIRGYEEGKLREKLGL
ncbi:glutaredoxin family protein [Bacillus phage 1_ICo-2020]|uniref:Glutaredoxin family protein n=1 Tax=Bacillus phage 1_ICo-2020 TaxID=2759272 RepID=A0A7G8AKB3_9CAUD|nr:glutaredoxin family protein [Bacillus phage 1_ICo-2020]